MMLYDYVCILVFYISLFNFTVFYLYLYLIFIIWKIHFFFSNVITNKILVHFHSENMYKKLKYDYLTLYFELTTLIMELGRQF